MERLLNLLSYYLLGILGIIVISTLPILFEVQGWAAVSSYFSKTLDLFKLLLQPGKWVYQYSNLKLPLLETLAEPYLYSMTILNGAVLSGFGAALFLASLTVMLPKVFLQTVKSILNFLEAVPDLLLAVFLQLTVVLIARETGVYVVQFVAYRDHIYLAPILVLSVLPMVGLYKVALILIEEELTKDYVALAKSKGIKNKGIIIVHIFRNIAWNIFFHTRIIIWSSLSSLFIIEYIFNIDGITGFLLDDFRPLVIAVVLILIFTPFYFLYRGAEIFIVKNKSDSYIENELTAFEMDFFPSLLKVAGSWRIMETVKRAAREFSVYLRNPSFLTGFIILFSILSYSILYTLLADPLIDQKGLLMDEESGELLGAPPHPPSENAFFGTDMLGFSIFDKLSAGAKYTILFSIIIAFLRMFIGFLFAIPYALFLSKRWQKGIERFVDGFHYIPMTIVALVILKPILQSRLDGFLYSFPERILLEVLILTFLTVPLLIVLFGNEMKLLLQRDFIVSAKVLGGGVAHVLTRHIMPHFYSRLGIVFGQQFIQVLLIFIHLGVFDLYFGGTIIPYRGPPESVTNEWGGLIGDARVAMRAGHQWMILPALGSYMLLIFSMQLMIRGITRVQEARIGVLPVSELPFKRLKVRKQGEEGHNASLSSSNPANFRLVQRKESDN